MSETNKRLPPITWRADNPELPVQFASFSPGKVRGESPGMSIMFSCLRDADSVYLLLKDVLNPNAFGSVKKNRVSVEEALCISPTDKRMLHIATLGKKAFKAVQDTLEQVCDFRFPHELELRLGRETADPDSLMTSNRLKGV